jgi:Ca2+-binding RTX toxin-like protein
VNFDLAVATPQVLGSATIQNFERVSIVGGNQADTMAGGEYGDSLRGSFGADILYGRGGDDYLEGSGGRDYLDGGVGDDRMVGGQDDDIYIVDSVADQVIEGGSQFKSNDLVRTALSNYALPDFVEDLKYTGSAAFTGTGNTLDNSIEGGIGNDALFGLVGSDVLRGFAGDDVIAGGAGKDVMYGGSGADRFVFAAGDNGLGGALRDVIKDFEPGIDKIDLTGLGAIATFAIQEVSSGSNHSNFYINIDSNGDGARDMQIQLFNRPLFDDILI